MNIRIIGLTILSTVEATAWTTEAARNTHIRKVFVATIAFWLAKTT